MTEPLIRIQPVLDPQAKGIVVEKESPRYYVVSAPTHITPTEALIAVSRVDPDGSRRRGE